MSRRNVKAINRRSKLGSLWISLSAAIFVTFIALVYSVLFKIEVDELLPYIAVGYIVWQYISGMLSSMPNIYIVMGNYIKQSSTPMTVYVIANTVEKMEMLMRQSIVIIAVGLIFQTGLSWALLILPVSVAILGLTGVAVSFSISAISIRYRDAAQIINSMIFLIFLLTPIIWKPSLVGDRVALIDWNPFYHFIHIVRAPILESHVPWFSFGVCLAILGVFSLLGVWTMSRYRNRIVFWI